MRAARFRDNAGVERTGELIDGVIKSGGRTYETDEVAFLPPASPTKLLGIGANNPAFIESSDNFDWPESFSDHPMYIKPPNCLVGHGGTVTLPKEGDFVFELEFGVVIGKQCRNVAKSEAMDAIKGFTCYNDVTDLTDLSANDWLNIKSFDNSAPSVRSLHLLIRFPKTR